jgi:hypothetical protein
VGTSRKRKAEICRKVDRSEVVFLPEFLRVRFYPDVLFYAA